MPNDTHHVFGTSNQRETFAQKIGNQRKKEGLVAPYDENICVHVVFDESLVSYRTEQSAK